MKDKEKQQIIKVHGKVKDILDEERKIFETKFGFMPTYNQFIAYFLVQIKNERS